MRHHWITISEFQLNSLRSVTCRYKLLVFTFREEWCVTLCSPSVTLGNTLSRPFANMRDLGLWTSVLQNYFLQKVHTEFILCKQLKMIEKTLCWGKWNGFPVICSCLSEKQIFDCLLRVILRHLSCIFSCSFALVQQSSISRCKFYSFWPKNFGEVQYISCHFVHFFFVSADV